MTCDSVLDAVWCVCVWGPFSHLILPEPGGYSPL